MLLPLQVQQPAPLVGVGACTGEGTGTGGVGIGTIVGAGLLVGVAGLMVTSAQFQNF